MKKSEAKSENRSASVLAPKVHTGIPKNFRQQADIESFYRFVHENDLRVEAVQIFQETRAHKSSLKAAKNRVKH